MIAETVKEAIRDGASVVNLSMGINWQKSYNRLPVEGAVADIRLADQAYNRLRQALRDFNEDDLPLLVLSAGNDGIDAKWAGFPQVVNDFPGRVIVVGANTFSGDLASTSNYGSLVSVAAPGPGVYALDGVGTTVPFGGTSAAAPYVTGMAGLLKSFDPNLSAVQLKQRILEGAARGGRSAGGFPILDAYETLRVVAEEQDAPLCGNDVWASGGTLYASRTSSPPEELAPLAGTPVGQVEALHGGKFILYINPGVGHALRWDAVTQDWEPASPPADWQERRGGTWASVFGFSHERDTFAYVDATIVSGTRWYETSDTEQAPVWVDGNGALHLAGQITVNDLSAPVQVTCLERDPSTGSCFFSVIESRAWLFRLGYPQFPGFMPDERQAYVSVSPLHHVEIDSTPWTDCSFDPSHECRAVQTLQNQPEALVYRMDLAEEDGTPTAVETIPDETVYWIGHSENGERVVLGRGRWRNTFWSDAAHYYQTGSPFYDFNSEVETCVIEYRRETDFNPIGTPISAEDACNFGTYDRPSTGAGGGTIAPNLIPVSAPRTSTTAMGGSTTIRVPIVDPTGQEVRASDP